MLLAALCLRRPAIAPFLGVTRPPPPVTGLGVLEVPSEAPLPPLPDEPPCSPRERATLERLLVVVLFSPAVSWMKAGGAIKVHEMTKSMI